MKINSRAVLMREAVKTLIPMLSEKKVRVTQQGSQAYVRWHPKTLEPTVVNLPYIPDDASNELLDAIQGFLDHECGHILFTDSKAVLKAFQEKVAFLGNVVEDTFIERKMAERFPGSGYNLKNVGEFFLREVIDRDLRLHPEQATNILMVPVVRAWAGQQVFMDYMKDKWHLVKEFCDRLGSDIPPRVPLLKDSWEVLDLALEMKKRLKEGQPEGMPDTGMDAECADSGGGEGDGEDMSEGMRDDTYDDDKKDKKTKKDKKEKKDKKDEKKESDKGKKKKGEKEDGDDKDDKEKEDEGEGDKEEGTEGKDKHDEKKDAKKKPEKSEGDDEKDEGAGEGDGEPEGKDGEKSEGEDGEADDSDEGESEGDGEGDGSDSSEGADGDDADAGEGDGVIESGGDPADPSKDFDPETASRDAKFYEDLEKGATPDFDDAVALAIGKAMLDETRDAEYLIFSKEGDVIENLDHEKQGFKDSMLTEIQDEVDHLIGPLQKDMERAIAARSASIWTGGHRSGRLNNGSIYRVPNGGEDVFRRRHVSNTKDVAVSIVVDCSGSMNGPKIRLAAQTAYGLSSVLDRMNINHEVIGFTTRSMPREMIDALRKEIAEGREYSRLEAIYMPVLKGFNERMTSDNRKRFAALPHNRFMNQNIDGESVQVAAYRLLAQRQSRKIMMVLSDGLPACPGDMHAIRKHLKFVIEDIQRNKIDVVGIGILSDAVSRYYPKYVVLQALNDLPTQVMGQIKRLLLV